MNSKPTSSSLRYKLPLLISALLCVVVVVLCWLGYREIEKVLIDATATRLISVTQQISALLGESGRRIQNDLRLIGRDSSIMHFLDHPDAASRASVEDALSHSLTPQAVAYSLTNRDRSHSVRVGKSFTPIDADARVQTAIKVSEPAVDVTPVGPIVATDSGLIYRVHVPLIKQLAGESPDTVGYLTQYRSVNVGQGDALNQLIGSNAAFLVGNTDGKLWTNLAKPIAIGVAPQTEGKLAEYKNAKGEALLGVTSHVPGTQWVAWVQVPRGTALVPARRFVLGMAGIALIVVLIGGVAALVLSHRVTSPLADVSRAAVDVAQGDYSRRVNIKRTDEIGSLAVSFNSMAQQVEESNQALQRNTHALKASNANLRDSERRYRQLVELLPDAVIVHRDERVVLANPAAVTLFGAVAPTDIMNRSVSEFVSQPSAEDRSRRAHDKAGLTASGTLQHQLVHRLNGTTLNAETTSIPFTHDGKPAALMILRDVSERERLEERMRQSQKMEAVGQLAGGVAHDFNNLLTVVTGYSAMLLSELTTDNPIRGDIQEIANAADRAAALTRQLLAYSRQQVLEPQVLNLNDIVRDMEKLLRRVIPSAIQFETHLDPHLGRISADPGQLEQVLMNLTVNARDSMPDGGTLEIETTVVEVGETDAPMHSGAQPGTYALLTVSDSGIGMNSALQARIFDPFFTTKPAGSGTGLGLSTVYGIVKQSGGHIWVYSEVNHGSVFRIYLPLVEAAPSQRPALGHVSDGRSGHETVLLVEDEPSVRTAARRILEGSGYTVLEAPGGREALAICSTYDGTIHALLTDMVMPELSGRDLGAKFRELMPNAPIIYMSGYTEDTVLRASIMEPGISFVQKPFTPRALAHKIRLALDQANIAQQQLNAS
ncbi:MAG: ATP-binding protein [Gemmatimonadaceae bacterium]